MISAFTNSQSHVIIVQGTMTHRTAYVTLAGSDAELLTRVVEVLECINLVVLGKVGLGKPWEVHF